MFSKEVQVLARPGYEAIKKISKGNWEWEPEVGEWAYDSFYWGHIIWTDGSTCWLRYRDEEDTHVETKNIIPLLHWEKLEEILVKCGYELLMGGSLYFNDFSCGIVQDDKDKYIVVPIEAKTRQEAVMLAVIELGERNK